MAELIVSSNNLYAYGGRKIILSENEEELERPVLPYKKSPQDRPYIIKQGDSIDEIAFDFYQYQIANPERYWFYIADVNQDIIDNPLDLSGLLGRTIIIPDPVRLDLI